MNELNEVCNAVADSVIQDLPKDPSVKPAIPRPDTTPGQLLLRHREVLFQQVAREERLNELIYHFLVMSSFFAALYGLALGSYSSIFQMISSAVKVPALLFVTLAVCSPALFTFNVLMGSDLNFKQTLSVLMTMTYLISIILSAFAPILMFFELTGANYNFTMFLNVLMFTIAGYGGISILWTQMNYLSQRSHTTDNRWIIAIWIFIYMFVGTQMAWTLRPFVSLKGSFVLYREVEGNFYTAIFKVISNLF